MRLLRLPLAALLLILAVGATPLPTSVRLSVLDDLGNKVEGASVTLYENEEDYNQNTNPVNETVQTDVKGRVTIKDLKAQEYFVNVEKGDLNNYGTGVKIGPISSGKLNKATIIIQE